MSQNLTFMDAYNAQCKLRDSSARMLTNLSQRISEEEISDELNKVAFLLSEERTPSVLKQIKSKLKQIPVSFSNLVGSWQDNDGLDILHHSIINNCPEMVEFLLMQSSWFPPSQMPARNPYAHLAATFGFSECVKLILQYRPIDYFSGSKPSHCIKLPNYIRKRLKSPDHIRNTSNKHIEKLLSKIKNSAETAEIAISRMDTTMQDVKDLDNALTKELNAIEKSHDRPGISSKKLRGLTVNIKSTKESKRTTTSHSTSQAPPRHTSVKFSSIDNEDKKIISRPRIDKPVELKLKKCSCKTESMIKKRHIISVYWDLFSSVSKGVVEGAGNEVQIKYFESTNSQRHTSEIIDKDKKVTIPGKTMSVQFKNKSLFQNKTSKHKTAMTTSSRSGSMFPTVLEHGIRGRKKYKDFHLNLDIPMIETKYEIGDLKNKTPLSVAAQYGYLDCVQTILESFILKKHSNMVVKEPLTLATKAKSPDAIILLMEQKVTRTDFQSAVLLAIRDMYPDCLAALLGPQKNKERQALFDGINLYHILYTQCLLSDYRYEMLPTMTNALINSNEDVNSRNVHSTFPMYTLINCAFNITIGKRIFYYVECLKILLENKANPHYDEGRAPKVSNINQAFSRSSYSSAINCILESAVNSVNFFESTYWSKIFMKKFLTTLVTYDKTSRRLLNDALFNYMNTVCLLGIDRYIVRCLLRYGANSDFRNSGKYAINTYFNNILPYLAKFEVTNSYSMWEHELSALKVICRSMTYTYLKEAQLIFLNEHILNCPIQALSLCRSFSYLINEILMTPRPLTEIIAQFIWIRLRRNEKRVRMLPLPEEIVALIVP